MATATDDINDILRQMAQIRRELHQDVQEVVAGAEEVTDWRRYIRMYPWAAVGLAVAVGYLIVPKRRRSVPRDVARQADLAEVAELVTQARESGSAPEEKKRRKSLIGAGLAMLAPMAWRAVSGYAMSYLEQWIAQQQQQFMAASGPPPEPAHPEGWPGGTPTGGAQPRGRPGGHPPGGPQTPRGPRPGSF